MAIQVVLSHITEYRFDRRVRLAPHLVRLRPAPHCRTPILAYSLKVEPEPHFLHWQQDPFANYLVRLTFPEPARHLRIAVELIAEMVAINPFDFFLEEAAERFPFAYDDEVLPSLQPYLECEPAGPKLQKWLAEVSRISVPTVDFLVQVNQRLQRDVDYRVRMEPGVQTCEETLELASGSCRDSAWLLVQILRQLGLAARFVSGYLVQLVADEKPLTGPAGPSADFTDLHAWAEVYLPGAGWVGLDPTSGLFAGEGHIPLACTPKPSDAAPISGATDRCEVEFAFSNTVRRIHEDPRVTLPYDEPTWSEIVALGHKVDVDLQRLDVRLTQGGEPTFVAVDDMDAPEWNTAALGRDKRDRAEQLLRRMATAFAPGALLHTGQGKWYPGEALPRWALGCYWRVDGVPIWQRPQLQWQPGMAPAAVDTERFAKTLTQRLGLTPELLIPAYEDPLYLLWRESQQPTDVDWLQVEGLDDPGARRELAIALSRGLRAPTGFVLPLAWDWRSGRWHSAPWVFRRGALFLLPGNSPLGLRLPLDALPWNVKREIQPEPDPFAARPPLSPDIHGEVEARYSTWTPAPSSPAPGPADQRLPERIWVEVPHTALAVEWREGCLNVFLPPLSVLEHYLDLIAAIEGTAAELGVPVRIEGYPPPKDERLRSFAVTPDPGVIEVNIHPSASWQELVDKTERLYAEARQCRLGAEKFLLDGRHTGTGGGNHMTLGAARAEDSPFLRRPDLLASMLRYWQNHPTLSYFFSGLFIGPTSQAPRVDEGRDTALYELEIALAQIPPGENTAPWRVDRLLRNFLVDLTGNTHRAEFCIDKLYSPDSASGRLGLLELRAFEMPPHPRMALLQSLLVRALVARFWQKPYQGKLQRWGTSLQDRWMLPQYLWEDLGEVCAELQEFSYPLALEWFLPFLEFRFPVLGRVRIREVEIELRMALEPWPVLGEEATGQGTARFVDASIERLQVRVSGMASDRYVVVCNGRRVPLRSTGTQGEAVAGVRYRAWQPASALHPELPLDVPLVFDLIDTWNGRSVGGCTYRVAHPGGRNYERFPVNAYEAEGRRIVRFEPMGFTQGPLLPPPERGALREFLPQGSPLGPWQPPVEAPNPEYPCTLDLRRRSS
ncbi:transglutaminase family protein [Candidatus Igneacidithiobacillus taiwanensis]|uniref:transglutaminase family protein n=1 Tax=Candidatus Igneacidithiobacillus taiwanensis TaxID=1945924 RepID=UPI0028979A1D|nr:transglutaminase family protein [Candidatus Igneacidithiobacillus taiwanensis]